VKVLIVHNRYQIAGGEDAVMQNEINLLIKNDIDVREYFVNNDHVTSFIAKVSTLLGVVFSFSKYKEMISQLEEVRPDVVHVHNYFPLLSPAIFYACKTENVPVVHTLHNYRAVCPTALLMFDGTINEASVNGRAWWAVPKRVYRNSLIGSFALACMVELHKFLGTWQVKVDRYIALTSFSHSKYIEAGWPARKIAIKPNFIQDPLNGVALGKRAGFALFVGRLSKEKGIEVLIKGWSNINYRLNVIGEGNVPAAGIKNINFLGLKTKDEVIEAVQVCEFIIVPSICYEGFPMAIVEAFACGTPVLCSRLGSMEEIVEDGITGLHFEAGNAQDLAEKAQWLIDNPDIARKMGQNARNEYLAKYTPEKNYEMLMDIYQQAIDEAKKTQ
jgi:glycosyltransferase involved in cell wall biosynthesis